MLSSGCILIEFTGMLAMLKTLKTTSSLYHHRGVRHRQNESKSLTGGSLSPLNTVFDLFLYSM